MKEGSLVSMYIALDPRGIDFAYPGKFKTHSALVLLNKISYDFF